MTTTEHTPAAETSGHIYELHEACRAIVGDTDDIDGTDYMGTDQLPPWVDLDKLWPAWLRAEIAEVVEEGLRYADPDGEFMRWHRRAEKLATAVCMIRESNGIYDTSGTLERMIHAPIDYDGIEAIRMVLSWLDPDSIPDRDAVELAEQEILTRLDK